MAEITLIYEDADITDYVEIVGCVIRDVSGGEVDCVDLKVDHAERWLRWGPKKNDRIQVKRGGYSTTTLYLNTITLEDGTYRIYATGSKSLPMMTRWQVFEGKTLQSIMNVCAGEMNMEAKLYGISGAIRYDYLMRRNQTPTAFLEALAHNEGAVLKTLNGALVAIGVEYAQALPAMHMIELDIDQRDCTYIDRRDKALSSLRIDTPFGSGLARAKGADGLNRVVTDIPVDGDAQAYRWAKGMLLAHNRKCEILRMESAFNSGYTAMARVDVESEAPADGQWIIDSVEHDLVENLSRTTMYRCITNIG